MDLVLFGYHFPIHQNDHSPTTTHRAKTAPEHWKNLSDIPPELHPYYILGYNSAVDGYDALEMPMSQRKIAYDMGYKKGEAEIRT